ncbi:MAG: hypothetical protein JXA93_17625 [Anaerolineae bacterium]|nr:hypothetical protein [Anaerolineae bacterium]
MSIDSFQPFLKRLGHYMRLRDGWLLAQRSLWVTLLAAVLIQLTGRLWPVPNLRLWTLVPLITWLVAMPALTFLRPLSLLRIARRTDLELGLKERISTAWELESPAPERLEDRTSAPLGAPQPSSRIVYGHRTVYGHLPTFQPSIVSLQLADAHAVAATVDPRRAFPLRLLRRPLAIAAACTIALILLAALPNPMDAVLEERAAIAREAEAQAERIEQIHDEIEAAEELSPEAREELMRQLADLTEQLRANPGDREEALADLSRVEEALRQQLDPQAGAREAALEALAAQLRALAGREAAGQSDMDAAAEALEALASRMEEMDAAEQEALARTLAEMAARTAQAGDANLAQALASLASAAQAGDASAASQAAQAAGDALTQAQGDLAAQEALQRALNSVQASRQAVAQAGQRPGQATAQGQGQGQGQGQSQGQGQGQGQGQSQGQGQGQGQGTQAGSGGGTQADTLPPARRTGTAGRPLGPGAAGGVTDLDTSLYVPWERRAGSGEELNISGQDSGQGQTETREGTDPLAGAPGPALVPYHEVYYDYLDAANQAMDHSYVPPGLEELVRAYFSSLEP